MNNPCEIIEIMSLQGVEFDYDYDDEQEDCENECNDDRCPRCSGSGCNYCLMLDW